MYTGTDLNGRENIIKTLSKDLPELIVVERVEDAEVALIYTSNSYSVLNNIISSRNSTTTGTVALRDTYGGYNGSYSGQTSGTSVTTPVYRNVTDGAGLVVKFTSDGRSRLLMDFKDSKKSVLERRPSTNFARKFVGVFKEVNSMSSQPSRLLQSQPTEMFPKEVQSIDLNGTWNYSGNLVTVERKESSIKASYASPNSCNGSSFSELLNGELRGASMRGKLTICTTEVLVKNCGFPSTSVVSFNATVDPAVISVKALIPNMSITYGTDGRCNVTTDSKNNEYNFMLTRSQ